MRSFNIQHLSFIIIALFIIACNGNSPAAKQTSEKEGVYYGLFKKNGNVTDGPVKIFVADKVVMDSITQKKKISTDVIYGVLENIKTKTKEGKDTTVVGWTQIAKDSVKIINPLTIDSLVKSFK